MKNKIILSHDPHAGVTQYWEYDAGTDEYVLHTVQDVRHILEANKVEYNADKKPMHQLDGLGRKVASIPLGLWQQLRDQGIPQDEKAFKRWLNDSENRFFRTSDEIV